MRGGGDRRSELGEGVKSAGEISDGENRWREGGEGWEALMARRHSWLQTPKDSETRRVGDRQRTTVRETAGGVKMIKIKGGGVQERCLVISTDEGGRDV